ncbi:hypothetical protein HNQ94_003264 [Salirhabdus euzebyi]|uniref:Uncharacterized protein n=1 Tax=Salirhabdus euzebyi TaxID=394506 RepID=A0A841Q8R0_9BACI|nr:hypothetical protein [Salirhabdus euzebyi]MBB6454775.1 hypothetical protein [Salirhabdus euzebyi]
MKKVAAFVFIMVIFSLIIITTYHSDLSFKELIKEQPVKIAAQSADHQDILYTTSNPNIINRFTIVTESLELERTKTTSDTIHKEIQLFNEHGKLIADIRFVGNEAIEIDGNTYELKNKDVNNHFSQFWEELYNEALYYF